MGVHVCGCVYMSVYACVHGPLICVEVVVVRTLAAALPPPSSPRLWKATWHQSECVGERAVKGEKAVRVFLFT